MALKADEGVPNLAGRAEFLKSFVDPAAFKVDEGGEWEGRGRAVRRPILRRRGFRLRSFEECRVGEEREEGAIDIKIGAPFFCLL